ncbi:hypothetical protein CMK15_09250 [Candidatus Poribacteria bacterium]|nr:hypothetical protein [Candidatus Poribacteria bacterium]
MDNKIKKHLDECRHKLENSQLEMDDLDQIEVLLTTSGNQSYQKIMYLHSKSTNIQSPLSGWAIYDPYKDNIPKLTSQNPPYKSVLDAVSDGWRILQFPRPENFPFSDIDNSYLTFEFILEKFI